MRIACIASLILCVSGGVLAQPPAPDATRPQPATTEEVMRQLSSAFRAADRALERGDWENVRSGAAKLAEITALLRSTPLAPPGSASPEIGARIDELLRASRAVAETLAMPKPDAGLDALHGIRHSCTACHLQVRPDNGTRGLFPARDGTVYGSIRVTNLEGKPRAARDDLVVFLDHVPGKWVPPPQRPAISQRKRVFQPSVLPVVRGTTVDFPNDDVVFHNVFSLSKTAPFDLGVYAAGKSKSVTFDRAGLIKVYCNIHPEMVAHVLVLNNPFAAVTDQSGFFALSGVPPGRYRLRVWGEFGEDLSRPIDVASTGALRLDLSVRETRKRLPHRNKHGQRYGPGYD